MFIQYNLFYFSHARTAFKYGLMHLGFQPGDSILLPEYICDVVLSPLNQIGLKYSFYPVNDALEPKWESLPSIVNGDTKAIMMIHYFGQPQDIIAFQRFCDEHSLLLIEDNAHGHGGVLNDIPLGTFGDIGISSPRKNLNCYTGGELYLKDDKKFSLPNLTPYSVSFPQMIRRIAGSNSALKYTFKRFFEKRPNYEDPRAFKEPIVGEYLIDKWSRKKLKDANLYKLRKARQRDYHKWQDYAIDNGLIPVFRKLSIGSIPWCLPVYAQNQKEAIEWFDWGRKNQMHVFPWPSLPEKVINKNRESVNRWKRLVCFGLS